MKVLILSPFSSVGAFTKPLVKIAGILKELKFEVSFLFCNRAMENGCVAMRAENLNASSPISEKKKICDKCILNSRTIQNATQTKCYWINNSKDKSTNIPRTIKNIFAHDIILETKVYSEKKLKNVMHYNQKRLEELNNIYNIIKNNHEIKNHDVVFSYNSNYSLHQLFRRILPKEKHFLSIHKSFNSGDKNGYVMYKDFSFDFFASIVKKHKNFTKNIGFNSIQAIKKNEKVIFGGNAPWAYSKPMSPNVFKKDLALKQNKKILILLSSPDENFAGQKSGIFKLFFKRQPFKDQISWLSWVFQLSKKYKNADFFIRPHPRFFPNKRENTLSEMGRQILRIYKKTKLKNVKFSNPKDMEPVWDHLKDTDLVLNAWSSAAEEFGKKGIPVLTFFPNFSFSGRNCDLWFNSINEYEKIINKILSNQKVSVNSKSYYFWQHLLFTINRFDLNTRISLVCKIKSIFNKKRKLHHVYRDLFFRNTANRSLAKIFNKVLLGGS
jgi:hypothetical protein